MIIFKYARWKNFLSTGNTFTEIQLDRSPTTLIIGENGAGKSTLLMTISGVNKAKKGNIIFNGENIENREPHKIVDLGIGQVPEGRRIFSRLTVEENLLMVAEIHISENPLRISKVNELVSQFQFEPIVKVKAKNISGGQFKRLIIAMALINEPKIMLLDEIMSALDLKTIAMLKELILNLQSFRSITCIMVDHLARDLLEVSNRCLILSDGKIVAEGKSEEIIKNRLAKEVYFGDEFKLS